MEMDMKEGQSITVKELTENLSDYFDEDMIGYLIFMYQFQKNDQVLTCKIYDNYENFWIDREGEISLIEQKENIIKVETSFKHRWRMVVKDKGIITLTKNDKGIWKISEITYTVNHEYLL